jgi:hypothetical protein
MYDVRLYPPGSCAASTASAKRLRQLEEENGKLKQLVAEQALDIVGFKAVLGKKS